MHPVAYLLCSGLGRAALRLAAAVLVMTALATAFAAASLVALVDTVLPPFGAPNVPGAHGSGSVRRGQQQAPSLFGATDPGHVVTVAWSQIDVPYVWGGTDPRTGFDCSGLTQWSFIQAGARIPRTAQQQFDATRRVSAQELQPGDLVFFEICCQPPDRVTHVGLYVGGGRMVHAPAPGERVRVESMETPYWRGRWVGGGRVSGGRVLG